MSLKNLNLNIYSGFICVGEHECSLFWTSMRNLKPILFTDKSSTCNHELLKHLCIKRKVKKIIEPAAVQ